MTRPDHPDGHFAAVIPTKLHGILDYAVSLFLLASPWLLDFHQSGSATSIVIALGASALLYSLFTDYEAGVVKRIPMPVHLGLDAVHGVLLALSPWLLAFTETTWKPHLILGVMEIGIVLLSRRRAPYRTP